MTTDPRTDGVAPRASVSDAWTYRGFDAIVLANDRLRMTVLPGHGAKIVELVGYAAGRDLLYHHPRFDVRTPTFAANVDDWWTGGIDEVAPTGHPSQVAGESLPFLGEFWSQPWQARIVDEGPARARVHLSAGGIITPIRLDRWMEVRPGEPFVRSRHRMTNVGFESVDFMWGIHPGIAVRPGMRIEVPGGAAVYADGHESMDACPGVRFDWPDLPLRGGGTLDLSQTRSAEPPTWALSYIELRDGWVAVIDPEARTGFGMAFDPAVFPVAWLWSVYGGWRGAYVVALEAWTSWPARLDEAIVAGRHRTLEPGESLETEFMLIAIDGFRTVTSIDRSGAVAGEV